MGEGNFGRKREDIIGPGEQKVEWWGCGNFAALVAYGVFGLSAPSLSSYVYLALWRYEVLNWAWWKRSRNCLLRLKGNPSLLVIQPAHWGRKKRGLRALPAGWFSAQNSREWGRVTQPSIRFHKQRGLRVSERTKTYMGQYITLICQSPVYSKKIFEALIFQLSIYDWISAKEREYRSKISQRLLNQEMENT